MMDSQRSNDFQATERIFRKVVHPGLDSLRLVDKNGVPINTPLSSMKQKMFILSPRGVPTRVTSHAYSGQPVRVSRPYSEGVVGWKNHYSPSDLVISEQLYLLSRLEIPEYNNENSYGHAAYYGSTQSVTPYSNKRSANQSHRGRQMVKAKSASSRGFLSSVADDKRFLQSANSSHSSRWNTSSQGLRLEKEWTDLANSRSLKRNSEIVSHRVDRMYFMTGNSINLRPKYQVDEDELSRLRELSKSRQSSRRQNRNVHMLEPCIEEEETVCPESSVVEVEENIIPREDNPPNPNHDIIVEIQPSQCEDVLNGTVGAGLEAQIIKPEDSETPIANPDKDTGDDGSKVSVMLSKSKDLMESSSDQAKPVPHEVNVGLKEEFELDEAKNNSKERKIECDGDTEGLEKSMACLNKQTHSEVPLTPIVDLALTTDDMDNKVKLLSPHSSYASKESGIQIDQELNEEQLPKDFVEEWPLQNATEQKEDQSVSQDIKVVKVSQNKDNENDVKQKCVHWFVDFDDVAVADLLTSGEQDIIGECMTTILKEFHSGVKKPRFEYNPGAKFQTSLKKRMPKKPNKSCKGKEKGPCLEIANPQNRPEEMSFKKFPNRKSNYSGYRTLKQEPVKCACRDNKENMKDLFVQGTSFPLYNSSQHSKKGHHSQLEDDLKALTVKEGNLDTNGNENAVNSGEITERPKSPLGGWSLTENPVPDPEQKDALSRLSLHQEDPGVPPSEGENSERDNVTNGEDDGFHEEEVEMKGRADGRQGMEDVLEPNPDVTNPEEGANNSVEDEP